MPASAFATWTIAAILKSGFGSIDTFVETIIAYYRSLVGKMNGWATPVAVEVALSAWFNGRATIVDTLRGINSAATAPAALSATARA